MEVANPAESDSGCWILIDEQNENKENPFEVVESIESRIIGEDGEQEQIEDQISSNCETQSGKSEVGHDSLEQSARLQRSVEMIQQSLMALQSESRLNSTEIEGIRSRLDTLLLKQKRPSSLNISCKSCGMDIGSLSDIVSRDFRGQSGPAILIRRVRNVHQGPSIERSLMTGMHTTAWEFCKGCSNKVGWRYLGASNLDQKYKIGMSCIETESINH